MAKNVNKATATGAAVGTGGSAVAIWLSALAASKWSMPIEVAAAIVSPVLGFITAWAMKWASRLDPRG